ncbi:SpoIIE family protein phosphatase [Streptomyces argyrophyllae]|uniref:protein-serine/threonine phosphatase n=1 Tax=Streptomyces argyrophylli TaxID=2726118 RepID=A0A6M4PS54_9ACTN|nr:SpoIIE family protein phosphatase [Streptomyces argyrophyllae]QJS13444.1 SpoIIE family protein phosphatase [Streptomyces argyrophyllae]
MGETDVSRPGRGRPLAGAGSSPTSLLDLLSVAAVVLDTNGRVVFWSPQAEELFGYTADEALGRFAARLLVHEEHWDEVITLFAEVMESGTDWAGAFPIRHKDGSTRLVEFRNMRLLDDLGDTYALGLAVDQATVARVERDVALSARLVTQSPIGLAILDTDLRYLTVNPALERMHGLSATEQVGRRVRDVLTFLDAEAVENCLRRVLETGEPVTDQHVAGRPAADPHREHAWSASYHRLEDASGRVLGVVTSVVDITERHEAALAANRARNRLALIANASASIGTTLDVEQTAHELARVVVPDLADMVSVHVLDSVLRGRAPSLTGPARFRTVATAGVHASEPAPTAEPPGRIAVYDSDRLLTRCVRTRRPVLVAETTRQDLRRIARTSEDASLLEATGVHSYLAVPLLARGEVLGALSLARVGTAAPFDEDDTLLACELAGRAATCIDNARWYQSARDTALTLQRRLLPQLPSRLPGLTIACRYLPAGAVSEIGGDWFDAMHLQGDRTALVVGDVMGSGINAAASMGQLRSATRAFAGLDLEPAEVLRQLDRLTEDVEHTIATCAYCRYDPGQGQCRISLAGHLPPALVRAGRPARLLDLPSGVPLGVGGTAFETTAFDFRPGDQLALYTDGLVETRCDPIDARLGTLLEALTATAGQDLAQTCDSVLERLRPSGGDDDVALLVARAEG